MAEDGSTQSKDTQAWPLPSFYFSVNAGDRKVISCSEVSGLDAEYEEISYRAGDSKSFNKLKMPGLRKSGDVTLKKGIFIGDSTMWDWLNDTKMNTTKRQTVTISLLDEDGNPAQTWEVANAWPKKITVEGFKSDATTPAIETLVLANEGVTLKGK